MVVVNTSIASLIVDINSSACVLLIDVILSDVCTGCTVVAVRKLLCVVLVWLVSGMDVIALFVVFINVVKASWTVDSDSLSAVL